MPLFEQLEKRFGRYAVPNLVSGIVVGQAIVYALMWLQARGMFRGADVFDLVQLHPDRILKGEVWRIVSFIFRPPRLGFGVWSFVVSLLYWNVLNFTGRALEESWGAFKLTLYLTLGYLATVAVSFFVPLNFAPTNSFLYVSLYLAFARLYPDYVFNLYFLLPVKAKWMAGIIWAGYVFFIYVGGWPALLLVMATVADFLLFFGYDIVRRAKDTRRRKAFHRKVAASSQPLVHECAVCGLTSEMAPRIAFRYCSKCAGKRCYCPDHLHNHEHQTDQASEPA